MRALLSPCHVASSKAHPRSSLGQPWVPILLRDGPQALPRSLPTSGTSCISSSPAAALVPPRSKGEHHHGRASRGFPAGGGIQLHHGGVGTR